MHLPLFLLRTVLYPHMPMSLHVFEERYQEMMRDCLDNGTSFGVVAIREGQEVGGAAVPRPVGTLARIVHVDRLPDGRMNLLITGATRFRVGREVRGKAYAQAVVEYIEETEDSVTSRDVERLAAAFRGYLTSLRRLSPGSVEIPELPTSPEVLAYLVAATLETTLENRQALLEASDAHERMAMEMRILRHEEDLLNRHVLPSAAVPGAFSLN